MLTALLTRLGGQIFRAHFWGTVGVQGGQGGAGISVLEIGRDHEGSSSVFWSDCSALAPSARPNFLAMGYHVDMFVQSSCHSGHCCANFGRDFNVRTRFETIHKYVLKGPFGKDLRQLHPGKYASLVYPT